MKKFSILLTAVLGLMLLPSCGDVVEQANYESSLVNKEASDASSAESETQIQTTEPVTQAPTEPLEMPESHETPTSCTLDVECILQNPELPTGCEVTALATVLNYCGFEIDKVDLCDNYMPISSTADRTFSEAYIGDPRADNGFGCYAPVIAVTAENYFNDIDSNWRALDLSGTEFRDLFYQIENGRPVVIWASMGLKNVILEHKWTTPEGNEAWFASLEHCMVLTGYDIDEGIVYAADPLKGSMEYSLEQFESVYNQMNRQAVVIYPDYSESNQDKDSINVNEENIYIESDYDKDSVNVAEEENYVD